MSAVTRTFVCLAAGVTLLALGFAARASDGVVEISQARAAAGGVGGDLASDPPGYPVTITRPGSYRLASNLEIGPGAIAIEIGADDVTVDLNGFAILGPTSCTGSPVTSCTPAGGPPAILSARSRIMVRNGTIRGTSGDGLRLGREGRIDNLTFEVNAGSGAVLNWGADVVECIAHRNGEYGIAALSGNVRSVVVAGNGGVGVGMGGVDSTVVSDVIAAGNGGHGVDVPIGRVGPVVAVSNVGWGVSGSFASLPVAVTDSVVRANGTGGILLAAQGGLARNVVVGNGGTQVSGGQLIGCNRIGATRVCPP